MYRVAAYFALSIITCSSMAASFGELHIDEVVSVYDGDTFKVNINSLHPLLGERISIRIAGINTPELKGKCEYEKAQARKAKKFTVEQLRRAKKILLKEVRRDKYFRILADTYVDGKSLSNLLLESNLAVKYHGGKKVNIWCE